MSGILHVIVAESPWSGTAIRYRRHRLAEYVNAQPSTAAVYWIYRRRRPADQPPDRSASNAGRAIHEVPIPGSRGIDRYVEPLHAAHIRLLADDIQRHPASSRVLWFTVPGYDALMRACPWDRIVYDCSDFWGGLHTDRTLKARLYARLKARLKMRSEARIVRGSHLLFASSAFLSGRLKRTFGRDALVVENGVDANSFRHAETPAALERELPPRPRLAFVGSLKSRKIDFELLHAVATASPGYSLILIGPAKDRIPALGRLLNLPNVTWLGARESDEIPGLMEKMDLGLLPYRELTYNQGVFPLKFFEYLAADLPVVGCGLPSTADYVEDGVYVHTEGTPTAFLAACQAALRWEPVVPRRVVMAEQNDWRPKLARIHSEVIQSLSGSP